jgi:hypothetical protein
VGSSRPTTPHAQGQGKQPVKKRKRNNNKREPTKDEFGTEEEYLAAWHKWRETRDNNNESVSCV